MQVHVFKHASLQVYMYECMHVYTSSQAFNHINIPVCKYEKMEACINANMQVCYITSMHVREYANNLQRLHFF